jgi:hypothetical protein
LVAGSGVAATPAGRLSADSSGIRNSLSANW